MQYCMRADTMTEISSEKVQRESEVFVHRKILTVNHSNSCEESVP